jgi:hypothetical protein
MAGDVDPGFQSKPWAEISQRFGIEYDERYVWD